MEELAHIHLRHQPGQLDRSGDVVLRTWNGFDEKHAYSVAAASLLPKHILKGACTGERNVAEVARCHNVSPALVRFRAAVLRIPLRE